MKIGYFRALLFLIMSFSHGGAVAGDAKNLELYLGDSEGVVVNRWGKPAKVSRTFKDGKSREVWIYNCERQTPCPQDCDWYYQVPCYYLFSEDGGLKGWHDVR